jgi:hypothetical protein
LHSFIYGILIIPYLYEYLQTKRPLENLEKFKQHTHTTLNQTLLFCSHWGVVSDEMGDYGGPREDVDLEAFPTAKKLVEKCVEFFDEVQNL